MDRGIGIYYCKRNCWGYSHGHRFFNLWTIDAYIGNRNLPACCCRENRKTSWMGPAPVCLLSDHGYTEWITVSGCFYLMASDILMISAGAFDTVMSFFFYIPNLLAAEAFIRVRNYKTSPLLNLLSAFILLLMTGFLMLGTYYFTKFYWGSCDLCYKYTSYRMKTNSYFSFN